MIKDKKLKDAPLILVAAQINFSPVENIVTHIPSIQSKLKEAGFPYFHDKYPLQELTITPEIGLQVNDTKQWIYIDRKKKTGVVLTKNTLTVNTLAYSTFVNYRSTFARVLEIIAHELSLETYNTIEQISLRYVNHICSIQGKKPEELIRKEFLGGFIDDDSVQLRQVLIEKQTSKNGFIRMIVFKPIDHQSVLADIQATRLDLRGLDKETSRIILDITHIKEMRGEDFIRQGILINLEQLHQNIEDLFFQRIPTEEALKYWKGE